MARRTTTYCVVLLLLGAGYAHSVPVDTGWIPWPQADGSSFIGRSWGDESAMTFETPAGYRFVHDGYRGYSYYAVLDDRGEYAKSEARVGVDPPARYDILPGLERTPARLAAIGRERATRGEGDEEPTPAGGLGKLLLGSPTTWASLCTLDVVLLTFQDATDPSGGEDYYLYDQPYGYKIRDFARMLTGGYDGAPALTGNVTLTNGDQLPETFGSLRAYYDQVSGGDDTLHVRILNDSTSSGYPVWVPLPEMKYYYAETIELEDIWDLVEDAAQDAGLTVPTDSYSADRRKRHKVLYLYAGAVFTMNTDAKALHPHADQVSSPTDVGFRYIMGEREGFGNTDHGIDRFAGIGTHAHEVGHLLGLRHCCGYWSGPNPHIQGNPTNTNSTGANVIGWGLMTGGGNQGPALTANGYTAAYRSCPNPVEAVYRADLGWPTIIDVTETTTGLHIAAGPDTLYRISATGATYFLEHRTAAGFGQYVAFYHYTAAPGLFIWRRTDDIERPLLILADGRRILDARDYDQNPNVVEYLDMLTDPFPGPDNVQNAYSFASTSLLRQTTAWYYSTACGYTGANPDPGDVHIAIRNITNQGTHSTADVYHNYWSGPLSSSTTWTGTVYVGGDVTVGEGTTLSVAKNTAIEFMNGADLIVEGTLHVLGNLTTTGDITVNGTLEIDSTLKVDSTRTLVVGAGATIKLGGGGVLLLGAYDGLVAQGSFSAQRKYLVPSGWSFGSLADTVSPDTLPNVLPRAISAFIVTNSQSVQVHKLKPRPGYWFNMGSGMDSTLSGPALTKADTSATYAGWNIFGMPLSSFKRSNVNGAPGQIISIFKYSNGYVQLGPNDVMYSGQGYYYNLNSAGGTITIPGPGQGAKAVAVSIDPVAPDGPVVWASGANEAWQGIRLGVPDEAVRDWPPIPPSPELFDFRADLGDREVGELPASAEPTSYNLRVQGRELRVGLKAPPGTDVAWELSVNDTPVTVNSSAAVTSTEHLLLRQVKPIVASRPVEAVALEGNYPNPFNPSTVITYEVAKFGSVRLTVYNVLGQPVRELVNTTQGPGRYQVPWDGLNAQGVPVASGVFIYRTEAEGTSPVSRRMLLLR